MIGAWVDLPWQLQVVVVGLIFEVFAGLSYILKAQYPDTPTYHLGWGISDATFGLLFIWGSEHFSLRYLIVVFYYAAGALSNFYRIKHPRQKPITFTPGQRSGAIAFLAVVYLLILWAVTTG